MVEEPAIPFFILAERAEAALSFLVASPLSRALRERVRALGDCDFRGVLAWAPAKEETHLYLEVLEATETRLNFRGNFLAGVLLLTAHKGELPLATAAFETDTGATALPVGEEMELGCLGTTPTTFWLFTQVNLDFFKKASLTWPWLV